MGPFQIRGGVKICEDMLFSRQRSSSASRKNIFFTFGDAVWRWLLLLEGSLELQKPLGQLCTTLKEAWLQALQEALHRVRLTYIC